MMRHRSTVALAATVLAAAAAGGCRDDGRTLDPAPSVPPSLATTSTAGPIDEGFTIEPAELSLSSSAFADGGALDPTFTCDGLNVPPPLTITGLRSGIAEVAVVVTDRDLGLIHWVLAGLPPTVTVLEPGLIPPEAVTARTSSDVDGWDGPCPPEGDAPHTYAFTVYSMVERVGLAPGLDGPDAVAIIERAAVDSATLTATYARTEPG